MIMPIVRFAFRTVLPVLMLGIAAVVLGAQEIQGLPEVSAQAQQTLRPYWHVFAAYTIVVVLTGGWTLSIARRLRAIEDRLVD